MSQLMPGTEVGAQRWPWWAAHPSTWGRPWKGVVLSPADPRAWKNTLAFPRGQPDPVAIREHLARHATLGVTRVPVLWEFGEVEWESADALRPYTEDVAAWELARQAALAAGKFPRARVTDHPKVP
jgi:hypothetical protein